MCLNTTKPAKIAEKPIIVYKIIGVDNKTYRTPCQGNVVMINDTLKASVDTEPYKTGEEYEIKGEGVHAYTSIKNAKKNRRIFENLNSIFKNINRMQYYVITKCEIPAGAKYWEGTGSWEGEIAATEMKFIKICEG